MKKTVLLCSLALVIAGSLPSRALAAADTPPVTPQTTPVGPLCFSTLPFGDVLVWFLDFHGTSSVISFDAVGRDLSGNRPQSVSLFFDRAANTITWGYVTYPQMGFVPVTAGGVLNLAATPISGPGECHAPDLASCGAFTLSLITCPAGAITTPAGPLQGQK
jgi:hypothetical protein